MARFWGRSREELPAELPGLSGSIPIERCAGGDAALCRCAEMRKVVQRDGVYPVIVSFDPVGRKDFSLGVTDLREQGETVESVLAKLRPDFLERHAQQVADAIAQHGAQLLGDVTAIAPPSNRKRVWQATHRVNGKPLKHVLLAQVPGKSGWAALVELGFGGWNACPSPGEQAAYLELWFEQYGAELLYVSGDVIECVVNRPPSNVDDALELAKAQYGYCNDIVDQGCGTIAALASELIDNPRWFFWWD